MVSGAVICDQTGVQHPQQQTRRGLEEGAISYYLNRPPLIAQKSYILDRHRDLHLLTFIFFSILCWCMIKLSS